MILLAGHGARRPADPDNREPDGIDEISFRLKNKSRLGVDVTLLIVGSDFQIQPFYPRLPEGGGSHEHRAG